MSQTTENAIELESVRKEYHRGSSAIPVLQGISLRVRRGTFASLMGPSGSGKSTLLNLIAGLDRPSSGACRVTGEDLSRLTDRELTRFRARHVGFIFQQYNLIPVLTAVENVMLPLLLTGLPRAERRRRALTALELVGLSGRADHYPRQLSGGQEQRVAIARAIINDPELIVADEPTGDLDRQSAEEILKLFDALHTEHGKTILMVTHDPRAAERANDTHHLDKGILQ